jgi:hypothetical protein
MGRYRKIGESMSDQINVTIAQDSVRQVIDAHVQAAVVSALNERGSQLIDVLVRDVLRRKRDNYNATKTILEETIEAVLVEEVKTAMKNWVEQQRPKIAAAMEQHIRKNTSAIVSQLVDSTAKQFANSYYVNVALSKERP